MAPFQSVPVAVALIFGSLPRFHCLESGNVVIDVAKVEAAFMRREGNDDSATHVLMECIASTTRHVVQVSETIDPAKILGRYQHKIALAIAMNGHEADEGRCDHCSEYGRLVSEPAPFAVCRFEPEIHGGACSNCMINDHASSCDYRAYGARSRAVIPSASAPPLYGEVTFPLSHQNLSAPETTAEGAINYIIDASNHLKGEANDCRNRLEKLEDNHANLEVLVQQLRGEITSLRTEIERLQFMVDGQGVGNSRRLVGIYNPNE